MATPIDRTRATALRRSGFAAALLVGLLAGCGQPQVPSDHRDLVLRLATGTSTRDKGIIDRAAAEVDRLAKAGELADAEGTAYRAILDAANAGDWDQARDLAYALRDGQEPTEADRQRIANRTLPEMQKVSPTRKPR